MQKQRNKETKKQRNKETNAIALVKEVSNVHGWNWLYNVFTCRDVK